MNKDTQPVFNSQSPGSARKRILGYDFARALAFIGMVIVNFKVVMNASEAGPAWLVWLIGLLEGRAAATFVVLAGVGVSLLSHQARISGDKKRINKIRTTLFKRSVFLLVLGLLYTPIWPADILHFYAVYITIGAVFLTVPEKWLWRSAFVFMGLFVVLFLVLDYEAGWDWNSLTYVDFWTFKGMLRHLFFNGFHPVIPWVAFLLIGMWLGRQDVTNPGLRKKFLWAGLTITLLTEGLSWILIRVFSTNGTNDIEVVKFLLGTEPMPPLPFYLFAGSGTAMVVIMLSISFMERVQASGWTRPLIYTGQMALSLYVGHVIVGMGVLELLGLLENQSLLFAVASALLFSLLAILFSYFWRKKFKRGPLELVMRFLT